MNYSTLKSHLLNRTFCLLFLVGNSLPAFAQLEALQANPNITWIGSFSVLHTFDPFQGGGCKDFTDLTKFYNDPADNNPIPMSRYILETLYKEAKDGTIEAYRYSELQEKLSVFDLIRMTTKEDTLITIDPTLLEEEFRIIRSEFNPNDLTYFKVRQLLYFDQSTGNYQTQPLAMTFYFEHEEGGVFPFFSIKVSDPFPASFDIHDPAITWGGLVKSDETFLEVDEIEVLKNTNEHQLNQHLYQQAIQQEKPIISSQGYNSGVLLTKDEIALMYNSVDTITTLNAETYEEEVRIVKNELAPEAIKQFRLVQEWYYDNQKKRFFNRLMAIAPRRNVLDQNGNFRYSHSMYYIRYD